MFFGDRQRFGIEIIPQSELTSSQIVGQFCLYVGGLQLGELKEEHCSLNQAIERIQETVNGIDSYWNAKFQGHSEEEIFAWLDAVLYSGEISDDVESLSKFDFLSNTGEQFNNIKSFIYRTPAGKVHILFTDKNDCLNAASCDLSDYLSVSAEFFDWLSKLARH